MLMERWNWFMSANFSGKWIVTNGYAEVTNSYEKVVAVLRYSPDSDPYAFIEGTYDETGCVSATVKSFRPDVPQFEVEGTCNTEDDAPEGKVTSIVLTDGYTVIGLAHGARSNEDNLA